MHSHFEKDLSQENLLGSYLNPIYHTLFENFSIHRKNDWEHQQKGIDLLLQKNESVYHIDEKAQIDYLETDLPTFAFEISYTKDRKQKMGWLFDKTKSTNYYFLITGICCQQYNILESGLKKCKITTVHREKLIKLLAQKGLNFEKIAQIEQSIRTKNQSGKFEICELNPKTEGYFYYSKNNKAEQPVNLILKLDFLLQSQVGKRIYESIA